MNIFIQFVINSTHFVSHNDIIILLYNNLYRTAGGMWMDEGASGYMPSTMSTNPTYRHTSADTIVSINIHI